MPTLRQTISPVDGSVYVERPLAEDSEISAALAKAKRSQADWKHVPIRERAAICRRFMDALLAKKDKLAIEITWQMGRPIRYTPREIERMVDRVSSMADAAEDALAPVHLKEIQGFSRAIHREPLGVVLAIVPWNYPFLTASNIVPAAILAGNSVVLKHSPHTPLCAERIGEAFQGAGLPEGVFQYLHLSGAATDRTVRLPEVDFVAFTGSVEVGRAVQKAASDKFIDLGLELGGKDPAYVRADANLGHAIENLVDGSFFNSGQSCCGIERIYVHESVYDRFVEGCVALTREYVLGNPLEQATTLGPMISIAAADFVRGQIDEATGQGARALVTESHFPESKAGTPYLAPQILVDVDHSMRVMVEESFGPVVGIMKVKSDEEAIRLMNDSPFGLTASVWTTDEDAAWKIGERVETGTFFMNRCDYLDPELAWTGVKDSGRGCTLSRIGYEHLTRPKSYHLRTAI